MGCDNVILFVGCQGAKTRAVREWSEGGSCRWTGTGQAATSADKHKGLAKFFDMGNENLNKCGEVLKGWLLCVGKLTHS